MGDIGLSARPLLSYAQTLNGGGVERALLRLAGSWIAAGARVTLAIGDTGGPLAAELPGGVEVVRFAGPRYRDMLALPRLVRAAGPDVIFCPGNHYTGVAAWTRARLGRDCPPIVAKLSNAVARGDHGRVVDAGHRAWLRAHGSFLDHLVAMTAATAAQAQAAMAMHGRTSVIANPPALPLGGATPALPPGPLVLGVGRLVAQKRWDRLVAVMPRVDATLVILGEGALRDALVAQAHALGIADRLVLPGHVADPLAAMARADVLALSSDFEGVPGVLREALSVGTPVVATDSSPAVREIVAGPELGDVVPRDDPDALVAALNRWLAPGAVRPAPVVQPGADSAARYLAVFDKLVAR